jgi:Methylase of polypeptide chain release factors
MATVRQLLDVGVARLREAGSESARLDAELLLAFALGTDRTGVIAHTDAPVGDGVAARFEALLDRRATGEPVAYIRGVKEFHGLAFGVDPRALIPRPETEKLVELAELEIVRRLVGAPRPKGSPPLRVIDVGVGSGAVAVTVAVLLRRSRMADDVEITATDTSEDALSSPARTRWRTLSATGSRSSTRTSCPARRCATGTSSSRTCRTSGAPRCPRSRRRRRSNRSSPSTAAPMACA